MNSSMATLAISAADQTRKIFWNELMMIILRREDLQEIKALNKFWLSCTPDKDAVRSYGYTEYGFCRNQKIHGNIIDIKESINAIIG